MASGRPRRPNDPSIMASVEAAVSTVSRPGLLGRLWHWRYELALMAVLPLAALAIGYLLGLGWLIARAWCVVTPHRVRTGCVHAWVQTRDGRLPTVLYTVPTEFGERVMLWCRAGITAGDFEGARDILRAACWASDVRVVVNDRRSHIVVLEVIRRLPAGRPGEGDPVTPGWPYLTDHAEPDGADSEEPALSGGRGNHGPF